MAKMLLYKLLLTLSNVCVVCATFDTSHSQISEVVEKDIVIVGGGAAGSHAAVRLREDYNKSVILIEKDVKLGGHVDTYYDQAAKVYRDFGVQIYFPYEDALDFIARFDLTLVQGLAPRGSTTPRYADFTTGAELLDYTPLDASLQQQATVNLYHALVDNGYDKMIQPGFWNLPPGPQIPDDLLLPIGEFAAKYNATAALTRIWQGTGGGAGSRGQFADVMTLTVLQSFAPAYMQVFFGNITYYHIQDGNQRLYDQIATLLGDDVLLNATVIDSKRDNSGVQLLVASARGTTLIRAKKLLLAIPPTRENLVPFDLNAAETVHFSKPQYGRYHTAIVSHPKLSAGTELGNVPAAAAANPEYPFLDAPYVLSFHGYGNDSSLLSIGTSGDDYALYTEQAAVELAQRNLQTMAEAHTLPDLEGQKINVVQWSDHGPGGYGVSADEMRAGWMSEMYGLQGKRSTWFTGNAIAIDFTPTLWKFNDDLFTRMLKEE